MSRPDPRSACFRRARAIANRFAAPQFQIKNAGETADLYIYDEIGVGWFTEGVTAKAVAEALAEAKGAATLNVYVNSPGGDVFDGVAIYNEIRRFGGRKVVHVDGIAASAASMIAMAGDEIVMAHNATMMIHEASWVAMGTAADMRAAADILEKITEDSVLASYARTGQSKEQLRAWMKAETWMNAQEAVDRKFADRVDGGDVAKNRQAEGVKTLFEDPREFEAQLRDVLGLTQSQAKSLMSEGWRALATRDVDDEALAEVTAAIRRHTEALTRAARGE